MTRGGAPLALMLALAGCDGGGAVPGTDAGIDPLPEGVRARLAALVIDESAPPADPTNRFADDPEAARLGRQLFFDPRFSGPLLDDANTGLPGTLGRQGEAGRVSCAGCHVPDNGSFVDTRSTRGQLSLASAWTRRRTPALLDLVGAHLLTWDGHRDTAYGVVIGVIENPAELNSSRLFAAQQIAALYREPYEAIFGPLPSLDAYETLAPEEAGCTSIPESGGCPRPGAEDDEVTRVTVNLGKAIDAYIRQLSCGPSRFDAWMRGDASALDEQEIAGAAIFVRSGCDSCHAGPNLSDQRFHNVATPGELVPFSGVNTENDSGASEGLAAVLVDPLNSRGPFSDGDDGRLDEIPADLSMMMGAFRTPSLRCIGERLSYMHNGVFRSLDDVVRHFSEGGEHRIGYVGVSEIAPLDLSREEREQLVAFLRALEGPGADPQLREAPALP